MGCAQDASSVVKVCQGREIKEGSLNSMIRWTVSGSCSICSLCRGGSNLQGSVSIDVASLVETSDEGSE